MRSRKEQVIGLRVEKSLKNTIAKIAGKETRSISQQVEHFVKLGIEDYLKNHPDLNTEQVSDAATKQEAEPPPGTNA